MIRGRVSNRGEAVVRLTVRSPLGLFGEEVDVVVDSGFTGWLVLPADTISSLGLPPLGPSEAILADGRRVSMSCFRAAVFWHEEFREVTVLQTDGGPLVGMRMLAGCRMTMDVRDGGPVTIEPLP